MSVLSNDEFYVEEILDIRKSGATVKYLVKWSSEGEGEGETTWEPKKNVLPSCQELVDNFMAKVRFFVFVVVKFSFFLQMNIICVFFTFSFPLKVKRILLG